MPLAPTKPSTTGNAHDIGEKSLKRSEPLSDKRKRTLRRLNKSRRALRKDEEELWRSDSNDSSPENNDEVEHDKEAPDTQRNEQRRAFVQKSVDLQAGSRTTPHPLINTRSGTSFRPTDETPARSLGDHTTRTPPIAHVDSKLRSICADKVTESLHSTSRFFDTTHDNTPVSPDRQGAPQIPAHLGSEAEVTTTAPNNPSTNIRSSKIHMPTNNAFTRPPHDPSTESLSFAWTDSEARSARADELTRYLNLECKLHDRSLESVKRDQDRFRPQIRRRLCNSAPSIFDLNNSSMARTNKVSKSERLKQHPRSVQDDIDNQISREMKVHEQNSPTRKYSVLNLLLETWFLMERLTAPTRYLIRRYRAILMTVLGILGPIFLMYVLALNVVSSSIEIAHSRLCSVSIISLTLNYLGFGAFCQYSRSCQSTIQVPGSHPFTDIVTEVDHVLPQKPTQVKIDLQIEDARKGLNTIARALRFGRDNKELSPNNLEIVHGCEEAADTLLPAIELSWDYEVGITGFAIGLRVSLEQLERSLTSIQASAVNRNFVKAFVQDQVVPLVLPKSLQIYFPSPALSTYEEMIIFTQLRLLDIEELMPKVRDLRAAIEKAVGLYRPADKLLQKRQLIHGTSIRRRWLSIKSKFVTLAELERDIESVDRLWLNLNSVNNNTRGLLAVLFNQYTALQQYKKKLQALQDVATKSHTRPLAESSEFLAMVPLSTHMSSLMECHYVVSESLKQYDAWSHKQHMAIKETLKRVERGGSLWLE